MENSGKDKQINPDQLPEKEPFLSKETYQYPQPADSGKPLEKSGDTNNPGNPVNKKKTYEETGHGEGLNEAASAGDAGAFEGFEDQQKKTDEY